MINKLEDMIIFCPTIINFYVCNWISIKNQASLNSILHISLERVEFTNRKHGKSTLEGGGVIFLLFT